jgi:Mn-containing catalase
MRLMAQAFLLARDTMHQNQWMAVLEELEQPLPVPNSFPQEQENQDFNYTFLTFGVNGAPKPEGRFTKGESIDGKGQFSVRKAEPHGQEPKLAPPPKEAFGQIDQMKMP